MKREREAQGGETAKPESNTPAAELTGAAYTERPSKADGMTEAEEFTNRTDGSKRQ